MRRAVVVRALCFAVALSVLACPLVLVRPVHAQFESLVWSTIRTPSDDDFVVWPSEVSVLAVGSDATLYTADIPNSTFYKSVDGGLTWQDDIQQGLLDSDVVPTLPVWDIAVAPDDEDFVAVVTDNRQEVYVSEDGGDTWELASGGSPWASDEYVADIDISLEYDGRRDIAVGTRVQASSDYGDVWVTTTGLFDSWNDQGLDLDVTTVRFSPDYAGDETIVAVASDAAATYLCTGYRNTTDNTTVWTHATDPAFVEISEPDEDSPTEDQIVFSDLQFVDGYSGDSAGSRNLFVSYVSEAETDDVYYIEDAEVRRLDVNRGSKASVYSIAWNDGLLVAGESGADGETGEALLHYTENATDVRCEWYEPVKPPSGGYDTWVGNAIVSFNLSGSVAFCGTSTSDVQAADDWFNVAFPGPWDGADYDESALSRSAQADGFAIWNQVSLIDTHIENITDYSLWITGDDEDDPSANMLFLATVSGDDRMDSIWRTRSALRADIGLYWERVDFLDSQAAVEDIIMRRTPDDSPEDAVFYASRGTNIAYKSTDDGQTWDLVRECPTITDFAVVDSEQLYFLDDNELYIAQWMKIRRWYVWEWTTEIDTGLESGYSLAYHGENYVFVGDEDEGKISVSTDGGETWQVLPELPSPGAVHIQVDEEFSRNHIIYAATEAGTSAIYRWTVGGSLEWETLRPPDSGFSAMVHASGVLYGAFGRGVDRTLVSRAHRVNVIDWDRLTVGLSDNVDFRRDTLRATVDEEITLWALDSQPYGYDAEEGRLWVYSDTFALPTPWPVSPATGEVVPCDICACDSCQFCFEWKQLPKAETYELWVAMDEQFKYVLLKLPDIDPVCCDAPGVCQFEIPYSFDCGTTYYWRVRATSTDEGEAVHSRWSPSMHFLVAAGSTVEGMHVAPIVEWPEPGATGIPRTPGFSWVGFPSTTSYEFLLSEDNAFDSPIVREKLQRTAYVYPGELQWGKTYFWRVRALEPHPSEWSTASFTVIQEPVHEEMVAQTVDLAQGVPRAATPVWVWVVIGSLALLIFLVIVAAVVKRR